MIRVAVSVRDRCLVELSATGHAIDLSPGSNISVACAAVTGLLRTTGEALAAHELSVADARLLGVSGAAGGPGALRLSVDHPDGDSEWLRGVTAVLVTGLKRMARDWPGELTVSVDEGGQHGP